MPPPREDEPEPGAALLLTPRHGQLVGGDTSQLPLAVAGLSPEAGQEILIQVLSNPRDLTSWSTTTLSIVDELYPSGVEVPGSLMHPSDAPPTWAASAKFSETYRNLIAPSCRGCHMTGILDFSSEELFRATGAGAVFSVCGDHSMPIAEVVVRNFWQGPYLVDFFGVADPCAPPSL